MQWKSHSAVKRFCCLNLIIYATFFTLVVLVNDLNVTAQEVSTSSISLSKENQGESKELAPIETRVDRGELPYSRIFKHIKPFAANLHRLPPLTEQEIRGKELGKTTDLPIKPLRIGTVRPLAPTLNLLSLSQTYIVSGGAVSVMAIASTGSLMTRLHFVDFDLPKGARLFVYSAENPEEVYGPYEGQGPLDNKDFWTPPIQGEEVVVEYFSPEMFFANSRPFLIAAASHMFKDPLETNAPKVGSCHNNIPAQWATTANAVGGVDFIAGPDQLFCTGTVLNNLSGDLAPFFLTAEHCGINNSNEQTVRVWWFYDAAGQSLSSKPHSDVSKWLASRDRVAGTDFTLLQILGSLPTGMSWSGWTTAMPGLSNPVVGIHHPDGSYKRISYGGIGSSFDCPSGITCANFLPVNWDDIGGGTTEPGSSGSGLWRNNSNPQLVGQLFGGLPSCSNSSNNDYYGRFDLTYNQTSSYMNGTWTGFDDTLEQNDSRSTPYSPAANSSFGNLVVKYADEDWYRISVPSGSTVSLTANFEHDYGDIDLFLYRGSDSTPIDTSESASDGEVVDQVNTGATSDYFVRVFLFRGATYSGTRNTYNMGVSVSQACNAPGAFSLSSPSNGQTLSSTTSVNLTWAGSANANSYDVYFGTSSNPPFLVNQTATSRTVNVTPGQTYWWKVVAKVNCSSATSTAGVWSFSVLGTTPQSKTRFDYDGDGKADIGIWRRSNGAWYIINSVSNSVRFQNWGDNGLGDIPVGGDFDGDGRTDLAVWRKSTGVWYILNSSNGAPRIVGFGDQNLGDIPVPADYDGDGKTDLAVWRKSTGVWYIINSSNGSFRIVGFGNQNLGDIPVPEDYDGDLKTDLAVWRKSTGVWYIINSSNGSTRIVGFGDQNLGDTPVPADYDGDLKTDVAVWRKSTGVWYIINSSNGSSRIVGFGDQNLGDIPGPAMPYWIRSIFFP